MDTAVISISIFSENAVANLPPEKNLIQNSNFTGTSIWIFSPSVNSFGFESARLMFLRDSMATASVSQTVQLPSGHSSSYQFSVDACCYWGGTFDVKASFFDANNDLVDTIGFEGGCPAFLPDLDSTLRTMAFRTSVDVTVATTATVILRGRAKSNKPGTYGPQLSNIVLMDSGMCVPYRTGTMLCAARYPSISRPSAHESTVYQNCTN